LVGLLHVLIGGDRTKQLKFINFPCPFKVNVKDYSFSGNGVRIPFWAINKEKSGLASIEYLKKIA